VAAERERVEPGTEDDVLAHRRGERLREAATGSWKTTGRSCAACAARAVAAAAVQLAGLPAVTGTARVRPRETAPDGRATAGRREAAAAAPRPAAAWRAAGPLVGMAGGTNTPVRTLAIVASLIARRRAMSRFESPTASREAHRDRHVGDGDRELKRRERFDTIGRLAIAREFAEAQGGRLELRTDGGGSGAVFAFSLPRTRSATVRGAGGRGAPAS